MTAEWGAYSKRYLDNQFQDAYAGSMDTSSPLRSSWLAAWQGQRVE